MPAGVSWSRYLKAVAAAFLSMAAGAQVVHFYYRPLEDLDEFIQIEMKKLNESRTRNSEDSE